MPSSKNGPDDGRGDISPDEREAIRQRSQELGRKLEAARGAAGKHDGGRSRATDNKNGEALGRAMRVSTELIGGVIVGAGLGWVLDNVVMEQWVGKHSWPLFFILFFLLGSAAGMLNVVRSGMKMKSGPNNPNAGPKAPDDEDDA